jgi:hypothetical protein
MFTGLFEFVYTIFPQCTSPNCLLDCSRLVLTGKPPGAKRMISAEQARNKGNGGRKDFIRVQGLRIEKVFDGLRGASTSVSWREAAGFLFS